MYKLTFSDSIPSGKISYVLGSVTSSKLLQMKITVAISLLLTNFSWCGNEYRVIRICSVIFNADPSLHQITLVVLYVWKIIGIYKETYSFQVIFVFYLFLYCITFPRFLSGLRLVEDHEGIVH